jgi:hypothetical protein
MGLHSIRLFNPDGTGTLFLNAQWQAKAALQPFQTRNPLVERDGAATRYFASIWRLAFPDRDPLPYGPIADAEGRGSDRFWDVFT